MSLVDVTVDLVPWSFPYKEKDEPGWTGVEVRVHGCEEPLLLIRGLDSPAGPRPFTFRGYLPLSVGTSVELAWQETSLHLAAPYTPVAAAPAVEFASKSKRQTIVPHTQCKFCSRSLSWAGDLDKDGALDLLLHLNQDDFVSEDQLFLSSGAEPGALVKLFATVRGRPYDRSHE